ncbi:MAG: T9SS type A sorting domain-containing protein [Longimonas sp.]|uniref:T9SS type A sorting domain-containing protein n=1 Tax=Longimonas sp. TaxID=2039626 RepID=UPI0039771700
MRAELKESFHTPEIVRHNSEDGSTPDIRFTLTIDPDAGPLPVELNNFGGQSDGQDALIEWSTASETDNAGFDVEHKAPNAESFERLSFVEGAGTTDEPQSYSFRASDLEAGTHTFRLRQVDLDGDETLSDPIEVEIGLNGEYELSTYPNPVSDQATVQFAVQESQPVTIEVYNTLGQRVRTLLDENVEGDTMREVTLNANDLASGLYIVRMRGESFSTTQKVTVVR